MPRKPTQTSWLILAALLPALCLGQPASAGQNASAPAAASPSAPPPATESNRVIPDYGGRSGSLGGTLDGTGAAAPLNPLVQAGRALEALVIVLVVVAGGLMLLKRSGLLKSDGSLAVKGGPGFWASLVPRPSVPSPAANKDAEGAAEFLTLLGSQTLPHSPGAGLHLVSVGGRVLLLGATGQAVTLLTEVAEFAPPVERNSGGETAEDAAAFAEYLTRLGISPATGSGVAVTPTTLAAATDRLQSLVNRAAK